MARGSLEFRDVTFIYASAGSPVFDGLSARFPVGWTGVIGPNGSGKTTLLRLACGELRPARGSVLSPDDVIYCAQRTDEAPDAFESFLAATDGAACLLRGQLGIELDWAARWPTLSHGERKRAQIAVALWREPRILAVDEPTNHIDLACRQLLGRALRAFRGIGLLVSHDRELLDTLCRQCIFIEPSGAVMRPGGYSKATKLAEAEQEQARQAREQAKEELKRLEREAANRRYEASQSHRKRSKRGLAPKDHDARQRINLARITGKDTQAGRLLRQMAGRLKHAQDKLAGIHARPKRRLGITMQGEKSKRNALFRLPSGSLQLGSSRQLVFDELTMAPDDRIALIGPNGYGKSTLVRHIVRQLDLPADKVVYLPQGIDRATAEQVTSAVRGLSRKQLGDAMSVISQLGSQPERLIETDEPSPGELRKLMLATGMAHTPYLIIMDEPTNHLDLPSIECMETALAECPSALLLVSHDLRFLQRLTRTCWEISVDKEDPTGKRMQVQISRMRVPLESWGADYGS